MFKIQGRYNGEWEPILVMRTITGCLDYVKSAGYDLNEVIDGVWYYIRNESYREPMYESTFGTYSEVRIVPMYIDLLDNTVEHEVIVEDCVNIVSEMIPEGPLLELLLIKIARLGIKDIEFAFGGVTKLVFDFSGYEADWIRDKYPEYADLLLGDTVYETV